MCISARYVARAATNYCFPADSIRRRRPPPRPAVHPSFHPILLLFENIFQKKELPATATERAVVSNLFLSFGTVDDRGHVTLQPHDLRRMLQSMGVVSALIVNRI